MMTPVVNLLHFILIIKQRDRDKNGHLGEYSSSSSFFKSRS